MAKNQKRRKKKELFPIECKIILILLETNLLNQFIETNQNKLECLSFVIWAIRFQAVKWESYFSTDN